MKSEPDYAFLSAAQMETIQAEADAWARELASGQPTRADGEAFRRWRAQSPAHERAWVQASRDWRALGGITQAYQAKRPGVAPSARPSGRSFQPSRRAFFGTAGAFAAGMAVVGVVRPPLGLWPSWSELGADYRTAAGEQRNVELAGQVRLSLNTRTSVAVQATSQRARIELIAGEAAVSAGSGVPCDVLAGGGRIRLDAGDIEVRYLPSGHVRVRCNEGSAQVQHPLRTVSLQAGRQVFYDPRHVEAAGGIGLDGAGWRQGIVAFHDLPLSDAVEEINRYRAGRVVLLNDELARRRISGRFEADALDEAIVHIEKLYQAQVRRVGDVVFLS